MHVINKSLKHITCLKSTIFWDVMSCKPLEVNRFFEGKYCLNLQGKVSQTKLCLICLGFRYSIRFACRLLFVGYLFGLPFNPGK